MNRMTRSGIVICLMLLIGCGSGEEKDRDFFTSGSREADQRAEQRVAKIEQIRDQGQGGQSEAESNTKKALYDRLGGEVGIVTIVDDFVNRAIADPRVNWERKGITRGGMNLIKRRKSVSWNPSDENVATLKKHMVQFISLSTGGPVKYEGRDMREVHRSLHITNAEFDASIGDLKATLDNLGVATDEQKELLAVMESTRAQVVEKR